MADPRAIMGGATLVSGYMPTMGTGSTLVLAMALDGPADFGAGTVTFGGVAMTPFATDGRAAVFTLDNPGMAAGDIFVSLSSGSIVDVFSWGTLSGYSSYSATTLASASSSGTVHTITNSSLNPSAGDFVLSVFNANGYFVDTGSEDGTFSSNMDSLLAGYEAGGGQYMGGIASTSILTGGVFSPQLILTGNDSATIGNTGQVYGVSLVATPVPEPSTYALLGGIAALGLAYHRRRRMAA